MYKSFGLFLIFLMLLAGCNSGGGGGGNNNKAVVATNADLSDLTLSAGPLDQLFQSNQTSYTATVGFLIATTTVTPTTDDADATVTVDGKAVISATASDAVLLDEGLNTIKVIVTAEDGITTRTYTIEVTRQTAADFAQRAYLKASNVDAGDQFGFSVALSGDTLVVGAVGEGSSTVLDPNNNMAPGAGAVYVFTRDNGIWTQQAYVKASNIDAGDQFGFSVALLGDTLAVGAVGEGSSTVLDPGNNLVPGAGAVYIFTRNNGDWTQQEYLKASNINGDDQFGFSIALADDTLAVGAIGEGSSTVLDPNNNLAPDAGAVYVFTRDNGIWTQQAYVKASTIDAGDQFGFSVALSGGTLAVGAVGEGSSTVLDPGNNLVPGAGAVYIFTRNNGDWTQQDYLKASNINADDQFGFSIALADDTLAVGAVGEDSSTVIDPNNNLAPDAGAVYIFTRNNGDWTQQAYLKASNVDAGELFGLVALSGDTLVVGAVGEGSNTVLDPDNNTVPGAGAAYVFTRNNGMWSQQVYLKASNVDARDQFGVVALAGDTLTVGAVGEGSATALDPDNNMVPGAGAVYAFQ